MFLVTLIGYVLGQVRLTTGSVWPPILLHIIWNVVFQAVFAANVIGRHEGLWVGEFGVLTTVIVGVALVLARGTRDSHAPVEAHRGASARDTGDRPDRRMV